MRGKLLVTICFVAAAPAFAADHPLTKPTRDVAVEYRSSAPGQAQNDPNATLTMRFASKTGLIRIEGPFASGYAILDPNNSIMTLVMTQQQMYMQRPADTGMWATFQAGNADFKRTGSDTIAGVACTNYDTTINGQDGQLCLTGDGVLLRARSSAPDRQRQLEAVKVTYADQPADLFAPPAGYKKLVAPDLGRPPGMPPGAPPGMLPGAPQPGR
jgi:hypothetical protein